jgi:murein DD-endopeptidase MepM/ murein hydrolase activator NlpD
MPKSKYKFNPESLSFDRITYSIKEKLLRFFLYFMGSVLIALIYGFIFTSLFDSPKEKILKRENQQLLLQYEIMNNQLSQSEKVLTDLEGRDDNIYRVIFGAEPIPGSVRNAGFGGSNRYAELEGYNNSRIVIETKKRLDMLTKKLYVQSKSYDEIITLAKNKEAMLSHIPAIMPISNRDLTRTASGWGYRIHPIYKIPKFHYGMDFTAPTGTDVYATGDGTIIEVKSSHRGYGNEIIIDHGFGHMTMYAHLNAFNVRQGQIVKRGDVIGFVGNTGQSTAPHLHYEVIVNGKKVNPINYYFNDLSATEYDKMIEISNNTGQSFD